MLAGQVNVLAESLEQMYDDQFIETCAPWAAAYIGDLVGYRTASSPRCVAAGRGREHDPVQAAKGTSRCWSS